MLCLLHLNAVPVQHCMACRAQCAAGSPARCRALPPLMPAETSVPGRLQELFTGDPAGAGGPDVCIEAVGMRYARSVLHKVGRAGGFLGAWQAGFGQRGAAVATPATHPPACPHLLPRQVERALSLETDSAEVLNEMIESVRKVGGEPCPHPLGSTPGLAACPSAGSDQWRHVPPCRRAASQ